MALTNIIREPRRELTETGMGMLISAGVAGIVYFPGHAIGTWFGNLTTTPEIVWWWTIMAMILVFFGSWLSMIAVHAVGENFCNNLARHGIELRPSRRRQ